MTILVSPVNFSEGKRLDAINEIAGAAGRFSSLLDVHCDVDHNRTVMTLAGEPDALTRAILAATSKAMALIDLKGHRGVHPRLGAIDVVPFVPAPGSEDEAQSVREAVDTSAKCARLIWQRFAVPVFLYELSVPPDRGGPLPLPVVRKEAFVALGPAFGGSVPHPTAGAVAIGARRLLVAFNVNLDTTDLTLARRLAAGVRKELPFVRALGLPLTSRGLVQVSCNLTSPERTTMLDVLTAVKEKAGAVGVEVLESEVAGLATRSSFGGATSASLGFSVEPKILEDCLKKTA